MTKKKSPPSRATMDSVDGIHGMLADAITTEFERCRKEGVAPSPQFIAQARQFLSDNGATVPAVSPRMDKVREALLKDALPTDEELEAALRGENVVRFAPVK
jgi:hypothetical protein